MSCYKLGKCSGVGCWGGGWGRTRLLLHQKPERGFWLLTFPAMSSRQRAKSTSCFCCRSASTAAFTAESATLCCHFSISLCRSAQYSPTAEGQRQQVSNMVFSAQYSFSNMVFSAQYSFSNMVFSAQYIPMVERQRQWVSNMLFSAQYSPTVERQRQWVSNMVLYTQYSPTAEGQRQPN